MRHFLKLLEADSSVGRSVTRRDGKPHFLKRFRKAILRWQSDAKLRNPAFWGEIYDMRVALNSWNRRYNAELDLLDKLEADGRAYVFYANDQGVKNSERDETKLTANFHRGRHQVEAELRAWERFISR